MLSTKAITEFQEIYKKEYREEISFERADEMGTKLLRLFQIIFRPIPKEDYDQLHQNS